MKNRKFVVLAAVVGTATVGTFLVGAGERGDFCAGAATPNTVVGVFAPDQVCFQTADEVTAYLRSQGVDVPDGLYDKDAGGITVQSQG